MKKDLGKSVKLFMAAAICGGVLAGCGDSENFVFTNTNIPVPIQPAPPVAVNDSVVALGNATLQQAAVNGVLSNDTLNGGAITDFDSTSVGGATVVLNDDGSFQYTPVLGFTGPDSFTYTLSNADGESTATVTVNVNALGFFVDNTRAAGGDGSQADPFNSLDDAIAAAGNGDTIFVYAGDGAATNQTGLFILPPGVNLIGQAQGLVAAQTIEPAGNRPVIAGTVQLSGNNVVAGLEFNDATGASAITGDGVSNVTIQNNLFTDLDNDNIEFDDMTGTVTVADNEFTAPGDGDTCLNIDQEDANATFSIAGNTFTDNATFNPDDALEFEAIGNSQVTLSVTDNEFSGDTASTAFVYGIEVSTDDTADLSVTITGNTFTDASENAAIYIESESTIGVDATISNNMVDGSNDDGIDYYWNIDVANTFVVRMENNNLTDVGSKPFDIDGDGSTGIFFVRNNSGDSNSSVSFQFDLNSAANACLDLFGNTFADNVNLSVGTGTFDVERFDVNDGGPLDATGVNSIGGTLNATGMTSQEPGFCQAQLP